MTVDDFFRLNQADYDAIQSLFVLYMIETLAFGVFFLAILYICYQLNQRIARLEKILEGDDDEIEVYGRKVEAFTDSLATNVENAKYGNPIVKDWDNIENATRRFL